MPVFLCLSFGDESSVVVESRRCMLGEVSVLVRRLTIPRCAELLIRVDGVFELLGDMHGDGLNSSSLPLSRKLP